MRWVKTLPIITAALLIIIALLFFPLGVPSSSVFYVSLLFLAVALVLSSPKGKMKDALKYLRLSPKKKDLPSLLCLGIASLIASGIATAMLSVLLSYFGLLDTAPVLSKISSLPLPALLAAFTLAPLAEEALFRGYLFRKISEWRTGAGRQAGWAAGALLSSLVFAAFHLSYSSVAELAVAFSIGMLFCYFTRRTNSLIPAIVAHASFNFLSILFAVWLP